MCLALYQVRFKGQRKSLPFIKPEQLSLPTAQAAVSGKEPLGGVGDFSKQVQDLIPFPHSLNIC